MTDRRVLRALVALVALAAAIRFWRIGHQSFWLDETFTVLVVDRDLWGVFDGIRETESTPPLYYLLAWLWSHVFGDGEAALRSLSALFGIATVPVAYWAARAAFAPRAALAGAALVAVNPWLVWYSQEARSYALLVLLATASLGWFLRAERSGGRRELTLWAATSALALLTHYFAFFLLAPEALWLLHRHRHRATAMAVGAVGAVGVALVPLVIAQRATGHTKFISDLPLGRRVTQLPKSFVTGELGTPTPVLGPLAGALAVAGVVLLWRFGTRTDRRNGLLLSALAALFAGVPIALALVDVDYLFPRNALPLMIPAALVVGAGFGTERAGRAGTALAAALVATAVAVNIQVSLNEHLQRDDLRGLAAALGPPAGDRAIVLNPLSVQVKALEHYIGPTARFPPDRTVPLYEVDAIRITRDDDIEREPEPPTAAFVEVDRRIEPSWQLVRFRVRLPRELERATVPEPPPVSPVGPPHAEAARIGEAVPAVRVQRRR